MSTKPAKTAISSLKTIREDGTADMDKIMANAEDRRSKHKFTYIHYAVPGREVKNKKGELVPDKDSVAHRTIKSLKDDDVYIDEFRIAGKPKDVERFLREKYLLSDSAARKAVAEGITVRNKDSSEVYVNEIAELADLATPEHMQNIMYNALAVYEAMGEGTDKYLTLNKDGNVIGKPTQPGQKRAASLADRYMNLSADKRLDLSKLDDKGKSAQTIKELGPKSKKVELVAGPLAATSGEFANKRVVFDRSNEQAVLTLLHHLQEKFPELDQYTDADARDWIAESIAKKGEVASEATESPRKTGNVSPSRATFLPVKTTSSKVPLGDLSTKAVPTATRKPQAPGKATLVPMGGKKTGGK